MTKKQYLDELKKELKNFNVDDIEDIVLEYDQHFDFKLEEGLTEEEIAKKLSNPKEIAQEFAQNKTSKNNNGKGAKITGLVFMSIPLSLIYAFMWASVLVLGAFSVVCAVLGFCLITTINICGLIPYLPYFSSLLLGISALGLALLSAVGTFYLFMYIKQWGKIYIKWCSNLVNNNPYPIISKHPNISKKLAYKLKFVAIIGLICFITTFVIGYFSMCISANSMEPWHVWNWFI